MERNSNSGWTDIVALAAILLASTFVAIGCSALVRSVAPEIDGDILNFIIYTVQFSLAVVGGAVWLGNRGGLKFRPGIGWSAAPVILGGVIVMTATNVVIEPLLLIFPERWIARVDTMIGTGGWAILMVVLAAPVLEELFFRGLLLETLSRKWRPWAAVLASAAVFSVVHIIPTQMVNALVIGIVWGYLYLISRSLVVVIIIHSINNGLAYLSRELAGTQLTSTRELVGNDTIYWILYAASAVIFVVSTVLMARSVARRDTKTSEIPLQTKIEDAKPTP
ncbi:MAG: CPBP family intramembrane metalloprotease [Alistipes sp.]|nr:CPBP family intramembrane metalloprotease [Alistipes sp.]